MRRVSSACWITGSPAVAAERRALTHDVVVKDGFAVVGDSDGAGGLEGRVVGERLAEGAAGCRRDGEDASGSTALRRLHPAHDLR